MKKFAATAVCALLAGALALSAAGCGGLGGKKIEGDKNKTQLNVYNYDGGVGHAWLDDVEKRFEAAYADVEFEPGTGKKGVDVVVTNNTGDVINGLSSQAYAVYFLEGVTFNTLERQGKFLDISDIVTETMAEGKSIESKLSAGTKSALTGYDGKYYVLPHYQSLNGAIYNKTLFDEEGWYFAKNEEDYVSSNPRDPGYGFMAKGSTAAKTCGPNGVYGDYDDGLPSSVEELERLCNRIQSVGAKAFIFDGAPTYSYPDNFINALYASVEGYDGVMANFDQYSETETEIVTDFSGDTPTTAKMTIDKDNFYELTQQASKYYALEFAEKAFKPGSNWVASESRSTSNSQTDIQKRFLESRYSGQKIAMLLDGSYFMNEATASGDYDRVLNAHPDAADQEFAFMPLPIQAKGTVAEGEGRAPTTIDVLNSYAFINANCEEKHGAVGVELAKKFLQFCYTDESLKAFTINSTVTKNLDYTLTAEEQSGLSSFGKTVYNLHEVGKIVTPISASALTVNNPDIFTLHPGANFWAARVGGSNYQYPYQALYVSGKNAKDYFLGMKQGADWAEGLIGYEAWYATAR